MRSTSGIDAITTHFGYTDKSNKLNYLNVGLRSSLSIFFDKITIYKLQRASMSFFDYLKSWNKAWGFIKNSILQDNHEKCWIKILTNN